jgi:hypothetical protein
MQVRHRPRRGRQKLTIRGGCRSRCRSSTVPRRGPTFTGSTARAVREQPVADTFGIETATKLDDVGEVQVVPPDFLRYVESEGAAIQPTALVQHGRVRVAGKKLPGPVVQPPSPQQRREAAGRPQLRRQQPLAVVGCNPFEHVGRPGIADNRGLRTLVERPVVQRVQQGLLDPTELLFSVMNRPGGEPMAVTGSACVPALQITPSFGVGTELSRAASICRVACQTKAPPRLLGGSSVSLPIFAGLETASLPIMGFRPIAPIVRP